MSAHALSWPVKVVARAGRTWLAYGVCYLLLLASRLLPGMERHTGVFMVVATLCALLTSAGTWASGRGKSGTLTVDATRIVLGDRAIERANLRCELLIWKEQYLWTSVGSAIQLRDAQHTLCIGGRNHLTKTRERRAAVNRVDASLNAEDFVAFASALGVRNDEVQPASSADRIAIDLIPSSVSARGLWRAMSPWLATLATAVTVGVVAAALGLERSRTGLVVVQVLAVVIVVGGVINTIRRARQPPIPRYRLVIEGKHVSLEDTRAAGRANPTAPSATRHIYHYSTRFGRYQMPTLRLVWPGGRTQVIGLWDTSYHWPEGATRLRKLQYVVGPEEWRRLVAALGLK
jgi:hypothetical protein